MIIKEYNNKIKQEPRRNKIISYIYRGTLYTSCVLFSAAMLYSLITGSHRSTTFRFLSQFTKPLQSRVLFRQLNYKPIQFNITNIFNANKFTQTNNHQLITINPFINIFKMLTTVCY